MIWLKKMERWLEGLKGDGLRVAGYGLNIVEDGWKG